MNRLLGVLAVLLGVALGIIIQGVLSNSLETRSYLILLIAGSILAVGLVYLTTLLPKYSKRSRKIREGLIALAEEKTIPHFEFVKEIVTEL